LTYANSAIGCDFNFANITSEAGSRTLEFLGHMSSLVGVCVSGRSPRASTQVARSTRAAGLNRSASDMTSTGLAT